MANQNSLDLDSGMLLPFPRPVPDWSAQILEYLYLVGVTLWIGVHGSTALLTAPLITKTAAPSVDVARLLIWLLESLGYAATIASAILLFTTLGMHLLRLRTPSMILLQLALILFMTVLAIAPQLWIVPKLSSLIRTASLLGEGLKAEPGDVLVLATAGLGTMGLFHLVFGAMLLALATRRCYRYMGTQLLQFSPLDGP